MTTLGDEHTGPTVPQAAGRNPVCPQAPAQLLQQKAAVECREKSSEKRQDPVTEAFNSQIVFTQSLGICDDGQARSHSPGNALTLRARRMGGQIPASQFRLFVQTPTCLIHSRSWENSPPNNRAGSHRWTSRSFYVLIRPPSSLSLNSA